MTRKAATCFLRNQGEVLLVRGNGDLDNFPGKWSVLTGVGVTSRDEATELVRRQTGLEDVEFVRAGDPHEQHVEDRDEDLVHYPFLFDVGTRDLELGLLGMEWVPPPEIEEHDSVPGLWRAYRRVAATVGSVRDDSTHGSSYLSLRALEVLRDNAAAGEDVDRVARELLEARPAMSALVNRVNRVMHESEGVGEVEGLAQEEIELAGEWDEAAARNAAELLDGTVLTLSRSGTVLEALVTAEPEVVVAESRPGREGVGVAKELSTQVEVTLVTDAAAATFMRDVDAVLVGADSVQPDGAVVNKTGTRAAAVAAHYEGVPCYVAASTDKISAEHDVRIEEGPPTEIYEGDSPIDVRNPLFDVTPPDLVTGIATEEGLLDPEDVRKIADEHRGLREW